jgi:hypothetical protein
MFSKVFPPEKLRVIPFPCHPVVTGDSKKAREKLNLPLDEKIVFTFGRFDEIQEIIRVLKELSAEYPLRYLCLTRSLEEYRALTELRRWEFLEVRRERLPPPKLYKYLHASDALLLNRKDPAHVAVSSTAHLCLGSLCPIICSDVSFFHTFEKEVIKYRNMEELKDKLVSVFEGRVAEVLKHVKEFVRRNSADVIAKMILEEAT